MNKIFEKNSYIKEFETEVLSIHKKENKIELKDTAFYGKSGGQPGDTGYIYAGSKKLEVIETIKVGNSLLHQVNTIKNLQIGEKIKGELNWEKRYEYMKMHTALHLLCSTIPMGVTGGQIGIIKSRLDFNADSGEIDKEEVQKKLNKILKKNIEISYEWISNKELDKKPELIRTMSVKPPRVNNKIRLVRIGDIDLQPCGGTHVKNISEIGTIVVGKIENKGKMNKRINISLSD